MEQELSQQVVCNMEDWPVKKGGDSWTLNLHDYIIDLSCEILFTLFALQSTGFILRKWAYTAQPIIDIARLS